MVKFKNKKTGRNKTIHRGQTGASAKSSTPKAKAFMARHGSSTPKQQIIKKIWQGKARIGSTVNISL